MNEQEKLVLILTLVGIVRMPLVITSVAKAVKMISGLSMAIKSDRLHQGPSLRKHLLKFRLKLGPIGGDSPTKQKL